LYLPIKEALKDTFKNTFMKRKLLSKKCARIKIIFIFEILIISYYIFFPLIVIITSKLLLHSIVPTSPRGPRFLRLLLFSMDPRNARSRAHNARPMNNRAPARVCMYKCYETRIRIQWRVPRLEARV